MEINEVIDEAIEIIKGTQPFTFGRGKFADAIEILVDFAEWYQKQDLISRKAFIMHELRYQNAWRNFKNDIWTMGNGEEINIEDMETSQIRNCINMLKRNERIVDLYDLWIEKFETELNIRNVIGG